MDLDIKGMDNLQKLGREFPKASARALNKTMRHVRTQMVKEAGQKFKAKASDIKGSMGSTRLATPTSLSTYLRSKGKRIALTYYMTKGAVEKSLAQAGRRIRQRGTVAVEITRGNKRQLPRVFVARMKSGHIGVFHRTGGAMTKDSTKAAIEEMTGPAAPQMLSGAFSRMKGVHDYLRTQLKHEIDWFLNGKSGGGSTGPS
jgi:hypothetical protein